MLEDELLAFPHVLLSFSQAVSRTFSMMCGLDETGRRYSSSATAKDRAAWKVVVKHLPEKLEPQAKEIIKAWLKSGTLYEDDYHDAKRGEDVKGLFVNAAKRPTGSRLQKFSREFVGPSAWSRHHPDPIVKMGRVLPAPTPFGLSGRCRVGRVKKLQAKQH